LDLIEKIELLERGNTVLPTLKSLPDMITSRADRKEHFEGFLKSISKVVKGKTTHDLSYKRGKVTFRTDLEKDAKIIADRLGKMFKGNFDIRKWKNGGWYIMGDITNVTGGKRPDKFK
jgi:hypothetical protein